MKKKLLSKPCKCDYWCQAPYNFKPSLENRSEIKTLQEERIEILKKYLASFDNTPFKGLVVRVRISSFNMLYATLSRSHAGRNRQIAYQNYWLSLSMVSASKFGGPARITMVDRPFIDLDILNMYLTPVIAIDAARILT